MPHLLFQVGYFLLMDGLRGFAFRAWRVQDDDCLPLGDRILRNRHRIDDAICRVIARQRARVCFIFHIFKPLFWPLDCVGVARCG